MSIEQLRASWITSEQRPIIEATVKAFIMAAIEAHGMAGAAGWLATEGAALLLARIEAASVTPIDVQADVLEILDQR